MKDRERAEEILRENSTGLLKHGIIWNKVIDSMLEFRNEGLREEIEKFFDFENVMRDTYVLTEKSLVIDRFLKTKQ